MKIRLVLATLFLLISGLPHPTARPDSPQAIAAPTLKWQHGGCYTSWCETGWYASPAVADLNDDGKPEVIGGAYTIFILNGGDGSVQKSVDTPGSRVWQIGRAHV